MGKFKDEVNGEIIEEFVGLRSKMYSFNVMGGKSKKTSKGIKKKVVAGIKHSSYKKCLLDRTIMYSSVVPGLRKIRYPSRKIRQLFFRILDSQPPKTSKKHSVSVGKPLFA